MLSVSPREGILTTMARNYVFLESYIHGFLKKLHKKLSIQVVTWVCNPTSGGRSKRLKFKVVWVA